MRKLLLLSVLTAVTASAALASPLQQAIAARQAGYKEVGKSMRAAKQALDEGDVAAVRGPANQIAALSSEAPRWFPAGSGPQAG
jgi:cytochrome c556